MKKLIALTVCIAFLISCKKKEPSIVLEKQRSWEEVVELAAKYGLADTFRNRVSTEGGLMYFTEAGLNKHLQDERNYYDINNQYHRYAQESKNFRSVQDYFVLVDSLPLFRRERYLNDEKYEAFKNECYASNYKFFIHEGRIPYLIVVTKPEEMPAEKARPISNR